MSPRARDTGSRSRGRPRPSRPADPPRRAPRAGVRPSSPASDENLIAAGWLLDLSAAQTSDPRRVAFRRAASAVLRLPVFVSELVADGTLADVRFIGPASAKVITDVLETGASAMVREAVAGSPRRRQIEAARAWRDGYISQAIAEQVLAIDAESADAILPAYGGDLQMHSTWSDGSQTLDDIITVAQSLGHTYAGVTDHSYGLPIAGGMSMSRVREQHRAIDALNAAHAGRFHLFKGIEANIAADGALDLSDDECRVFDYVVAAPHSGLRAKADQTDRMLAAVRHPLVDILGHPRGRRFNTRPGVAADWRRVFEAAAEHEVAVEIDGFPDRQDVDFTLARKALEIGCYFALDSDGHNGEELHHSRMAVAHARLAGIPTERILNCWSVDRLREWFRRRRSEPHIGPDTGLDA